MKVRDFWTEETWVKHHYAVDKVGRGVECESPDACKWCLHGVIRKVYANPHDEREAIDRLVKVIHTTEVINFNDYSTWEQIKAAVDAADI